MKKNKPVKFTERRKKIAIRPYGYRLHVHVSTDIFESYKRSKLSSNKGPSYIAYAFVWRVKGCGDIHVFFPEGCELGTTAHEMLHVVKFVMEDVGAEFEEEVWCYHLEELTQMVAEFIHAKDRNKYRGKKKK
jgi:hypothetical protein